jgi:hypothetical protein
MMAENTPITATRYRKREERIETEAKIVRNSRGDNRKEI